MQPVIMIGSSIFEAWQAATGLLPGETITNAAIGGTETADWLGWIEATLEKYQPRGLCYYCGSNDLGRGKPAEQTLQNILATFGKIHNTDPGIQIVFFSIILAPEKQARWDDVRRVNRQVADFLSGTRHGHYLDINPVFLNEAGQVRHELFLEDRLHLTTTAYQAMFDLASPLLQTIFRAARD